MPRVNVEDLAFTDPRIEALSTVLGFDALGPVTRVWHLCYQRRTSVLPGWIIDGAGRKAGLAEAMSGTNLATPVAGGFHISGADERIKWLLEQDAKSASGVAARKQCKPTADPVDNPRVDPRVDPRDNPRVDPGDNPPPPSPTPPPAPTLKADDDARASDGPEVPSREETEGPNGEERIFYGPDCDADGCVEITLPLEDYRRAPPPSGGQPYRIPCPECGVSKQPAQRVQQLDDERGIVRVRVCEVCRGRPSPGQVGVAICQPHECAGGAT